MIGSQNSLLSLLYLLLICLRFSSTFAGWGIDFYNLFQLMEECHVKLEGTR